MEAGKEQDQTTESLTISMTETNIKRPQEAHQRQSPTSRNGLKQIDIDCNTQDKIREL